MAMQSGWRWCHKCQGAFYDGNMNKGACPKDHGTHDGSWSNHYAIDYDGTASGQDTAWQWGWRWCYKCQGFFYDGNPDKGVCPKDGRGHDGSQSAWYHTHLGEGVVVLTQPPLNLGQAGWRWCHKCQGFFFDGNPDKGACPKGGTHDGSWSAHYAFGWDFPEPTSIQIYKWLTSDKPLGGSITITLNKSGDYSVQTYAHNSSFDNIDYTISAVVMTPDGFAFTFQHSGHTEGTVAGLPFGTPNRDDSWTSSTANNPAIVNHWDGIINGGFQPNLSGTDTLVRGIEGELEDLVKAVATEFNQKAAKAIVALIVP